MRKRIISGLLSALLILQTVSTPVYATNGSIVVDEVVTTAEELIEESEEVVEETSQEESSVVESAGEESSEEEMDTFERESNEEEQKEKDLLEESIIDESFSEENKEIGTKDMREEVSVSEETNPTLGICGDNLIWELENNILTISGTGAMYDFDGEGPWVSTINNIAKPITLVIEEGVTSIGDNAFKWCDYLTGELNIPSGVTSIGHAAFERCRALTGDLIIPDTVTTIGSHAFYQCNGFDGNLHLSNKLTRIESYTFHECSSLVGDLIIPDGVEYIGLRAFCRCSNFNGKLVLPSNVKEIGDLSFYECKQLSEKLIIPDSVEVIGGHAFHRCDGLKTVIMGKNVKHVGYQAFVHCEGIKNIITKSNPVIISQGAFLYVSARGFYPLSAPGWKDSNEYAKGNNTWIPYVEGDTSEHAPQIYIAYEEEDEIKYYEESGYSKKNFMLNVSALYMEPFINGEESTVYEGVKLEIILPDGLSFLGTENIKTKEYFIGSMDNSQNMIKDCVADVYFVDECFRELYDIQIKLTAEGYGISQDVVVQIPIEVVLQEVTGGIISTVEKYTSGEDNQILLEIAELEISDEQKEKLLFEYFCCNNIFDLQDEITRLKEAEYERNCYQGLIYNEMYLAWQYQDYLNSDEGGQKRIALYTAGLLFNSELADWLDPTTYIDQDLPGIKKYKELLKKCIEHQKEDVEYWSYIMETEKFIKGLTGLTAKIEKNSVLKEMRGTTDINVAKSIFNDFVACSIPTGSEVVIVYEEKTKFMEAVGWSDNIFKLTNTTLEGIGEWMTLSSNLENYAVYKNFLMEVYQARELPWEMRVAAFQLMSEMEKDFFDPLQDILNGVRDICLDEMFDIVGLSDYLGLNGYLSIINFSAWLINTFLVDVGEVVNNSAYTEGYAYLAMHYREKLIAMANNFKKDKTEENAWAFYEAYTMLWRLRYEGEEMYKTLNKIDNSLLAIIIRDCTGYEDKEAAVNKNLITLLKYRFAVESNEIIPQEYKFLQKIVVECPVDIEILTSDNQSICTLKDQKELEIINDYGKFISVYRPTTGDYVKIAYLYDNLSYKIKIIGQDRGIVNYTVATTEDHKVYTQTGFMNIDTSVNAIIETNTEGNTYYIDEDGDGKIDIKGEHADKSKIYVQFDFGIGKEIQVEYVGAEGKVSIPDTPECEGCIFKGWFMEPNGEGEEFTKETIVDKSITVYANWEAIDVLPEDVPDGGIEAIPDGIWIAGIDDKTYTSNGIKQSFRVYDGKKRLKQGADYSITYKNNKNAYTYTDEDYAVFEEKLKQTGKRTKVGTFDPKKAPQIIVKMNGNYSGNRIIYFKIEKADITTDAFETNNLTVTYTGEKQTPVPKLTWNGKTLKYGTDFYIPDYDAAKKDKKAYRDTGTYNLTLTGKKNFMGEIPITLTISESAKQIAMNKVKVTGIKNMPWTGGQVTQNEFKVKYGKDILSQESGDYTIQWGENTDAGKGIVTFIGTGTDEDGDGFSYIGSKTVTFKINGTPMSKITVTGVKKSYDYTGKEIRPETSLTYKKDKQTQEIPLFEGIHYTAEYVENVDRGTATILFTGLANEGYTGTKKVTFEITSAGVGDTIEGENIIENIRISFADTENIQDGVYVTQYMKGGAKPKVIVTDGDRTLEEGKDYKVSYSNHKKIALSTDENAPTVTVTGKGNYKGSKSVPFTIEAKTLSNENGITVVAKDKVENLKKNGYRQSFKVYDKDGKALGNKDYDTENATYTLIQKIGEDGTVIKTNEELTKKSIVSAGSVIKITVPGKGIYAGGEAYGTYRILEKNCDISKATIQIKNQPYTGNVIMITDQSQFKEGTVFIKVEGRKKELILGQDIEVVRGSYVSNINKGTAKVTFRGINDFGGTKTVTFKIGARSITDFWRGIYARLTELW